MTDPKCNQRSIRVENKEPGIIRTETNSGESCKNVVQGILSYRRAASEANVSVATIQRMVKTLMGVSLTPDVTELTFGLETHRVGMHHGRKSGIGC